VDGVAAPRRGRHRKFHRSVLLLVMLQVGSPQKEKPKK
jgi:hypothetical protein